MTVLPGECRTVREAQLVGRTDTVQVGQVELLDADPARRLHIGPARDLGQTAVTARQQHQGPPAGGLDRRKRDDWHVVDQAAIEGGRAVDGATGTNGGTQLLAISASASAAGSPRSRTAMKSGRNPSRAPKRGCTGANRCFSSW
jgi:hypothetical protein